MNPIEQKQFGCRECEGRQITWGEAWSGAFFDAVAFGLKFGFMFVVLWLLFSTVGLSFYETVFLEKIPEWCSQISYPHPASFTP